jgi:ataxia telangiectasia mutated family protein
MQQVFGLLNSLLQRRGRDGREAASSKTRSLQIRTYKIVPLSQRSGVLEWCDGTMPIKDYLIGQDANSGAHKRYHPGDWSPRECRKKLLDAQKAYKNDRQKLVKVR